MSTNINPPGFPDVSVIEKLANELFAALPEGYAPHTIAQQEPPPAVAAAVFPVRQELFQAHAPETSIPDPHFYPGLPTLRPFVPAPEPVQAVTDHDNGVNVSNPQSSLHDPHFAGTAGRTPPSSGKNGASPYSLQDGIAHQQTVVAPEYPFEAELNKILTSIHLSNSINQVTTDLPNGTPFYYFLPGATGLNHATGMPTVNTPSLADQAKTTTGVPLLDVHLIKKDFPILGERVNGRSLIWLDNAATTQKPRQVIERISYFYAHENSNIHRAAHELAARATDAYEEARKKVQTFLNAGSVNEIIFVRGATEGINLIAKSWGEQYLQTGDEIILSHLEHHANIVPWQQLAAQKGLRIKVIPVDDDGQVLLEEYTKLLGPRTRLVAFTQVSNALGTVTPARKIIELAHQAGAKVLVDGAQSVSHMRVNVQAMDCDWFVFSGHKIFGPTGIGVVYGKEALLNETHPWQSGGNMIADVTFENTTYHKAPGRFEAGTGNIADAVGLGAAIDYVTGIGIDIIHQYEHYLLQYATRLLKDIPGLRLIGTAPDKASVFSFVLDGFSTGEVGSALNAAGIAVRSGHHCAQPILRRFGLESTVRPSLAFYNTCADVDTLAATLLKLRSTHNIPVLKK